MGAQENLQLIDAWLAALDAHDLDRWAAMHTDDVVWHILPGEKTLPGHEMRAGITPFITENPDIRFNKVTAFSQDEMACVEWTEIGPLTETGKLISYYFCGVMKIKSDKITEVHLYGGIR